MGSDWEFFFYGVGKVFVGGISGGSGSLSDGRGSVCDNGVGSSNGSSCDSSVSSGDGVSDGIIVF